MLPDEFFTCQDSSSSSIRCGTTLILRQNFVDLEKYTRKGRDVSERVGKEKKDEERERNAREKEENKMLLQEKSCGQQSESQNERIEKVRKSCRD